MTDVIVEGKKYISSWTFWEFIFYFFIRIVLQSQVVSLTNEGRDVENGEIKVAGELHVQKLNRFCRFPSILGWRIEFR